MSPRDCLTPGTAQRPGTAWSPPIFGGGSGLPSTPVKDGSRQVNDQVNQLKLRELYAHAIPTRAAVEHLLTLGPMIEVGAGGG